MLWAVSWQGEMEEELNKSMRAFGIDPRAGRLSSAQYWAAHEELQRRRAAALGARPAAHRRRAGFLHSTILAHIHRVSISLCNQYVASTPLAHDMPMESSTIE